MKTYLFPHKCKIIGFIILIVGLLFGFIFNNYLEGKLMVDMSWAMNSFPHSGKVDLSLTITSCLLIIGGLLACFSKEKVEDEFIAKLRLSSLLWAVLINYLLLLIANFVVYGLDFLNVLFYNMFTPLIIFLIRFNYLLYKNSRIQNS